MSLQDAQQTRFIPAPIHVPISWHSPAPRRKVLRQPLARNCSSHNGAIRWKQAGNRGCNSMHRPKSHILRLSSLVLIRLNKLENQMIHIQLRNLLLTLPPSLLERNSLLLYPDIISKCFPTFLSPPLSSMQQLTK
jgi:hypothetical protein